jgi:hypothetical protein
VNKESDEAGRISQFSTPMFCTRGTSQPNRRAEAASNLNLHMSAPLGSQVPVIARVAKSIAETEEQRAQSSSCGA